MIIFLLLITPNWVDFLKRQSGNWTAMKWEIRWYWCRFFASTPPNGSTPSNGGQWQSNILNRNNNLKSNLDWSRMSRNIIPLLNYQLFSCKIFLFLFRFPSSSASNNSSNCFALFLIILFFLFNFRAFNGCNLFLFWVLT